MSEYGIQSEIIPADGGPIIVVIVVSDTRKVKMHLNDLGGATYQVTKIEDAADLDIYCGQIVKRTEYGNGGERISTNVTSEEALM